MPRTGTIRWEYNQAQGVGPSSGSRAIARSKKTQNQSYELPPFWGKGGESKHVMGRRGSSCPGFRHATREEVGEKKMV